MYLFFWRTFFKLKKLHVLAIDRSGRPNVTRGQESLSRGDYYHSDTRKSLTGGRDKLSWQDRLAEEKEKKKKVQAQCCPRVRFPSVRSKGIFLPESASVHTLLRFVCTLSYGLCAHSLTGLCAHSLTVCVHTLLRFVCTLSYGLCSHAHQHLCASLTIPQTGSHTTVLARKYSTHRWERAAML